MISNIIKAIKFIINNIVYISWTIIMILCIYSGGGTRDISSKTEIKHFRDTIYQDRIVYIPRQEKVYLKQSIIDSIFIKDTIKYEACKYVRIYKDSLVDSNIVFYTRDSVLGELLAKDYSYRLKVPIIIRDSSVVIVDKIPKNQVYVGLNLGGNKQLFTPNLFLGLSRNKKMYTLSYDPFNKIVGVGISIKIYSK